ncbi:MAG: hypothetical protein LBS59_06725 [Puniceicoccales bacterium]|jgi:hypothetical protein|nr:hypothetical protein [Puniceicoccales bacterium]
MKNPFVLSLAFLASAGAAGAVALVAVPAWWASYGLVESATAAAADNVLSQGELRNWVVRSAVALEDTLADEDGNIANVGAIGDLAAFVAELDPVEVGGVWFASPQNDDDTAVTVGELRDVAALFYDALIEAEFADAYPWDNDDGADAEAATVGLAAALFDVELSAQSTSNTSSSGSNFSNTSSTSLAAGAFSNAASTPLAAGAAVNLALSNGLSLQVVNNSSVAQTLPSSVQLQLATSVTGGSSMLQNAAAADTADVFSYDVRGWLSTGSLDVSDTVYFTRDAEGNIVYVD